MWTDVVKTLHALLAPAGEVASKTLLFLRLVPAKLHQWFFNFQGCFYKFGSCFYYLFPLPVLTYGTANGPEFDSGGSLAAKSSLQSLELLDS